VGLGMSSPGTPSKKAMATIWIAASRAPRPKAGASFVAAQVVDCWAKDVPHQHKVLGTEAC
jgi:hypothetical protein